MLRKPILVLLLALLATVSWAQVTSDFSLTANPAFTIPLGPSLADGTPFYTIGGGASLKGEYTLPFARAFFTGLALDVDFLPINAASKAMTFLSVGPEVGIRFFPIPRLGMKLAGYGGMYLGFGAGATVYNPFAAGFADLSYLLSPSLSLGVGATYKYNFSKFGPVYNGIGVNLGVSYHIGAGSGKADLRIEPKIEPIFPLFYTYYDKNQAGTLTLKNTSPGPIQDVTVSFFVKEYMEQPKNFWSAPALDRNQEVSAPVFALFDQRIFDVTTETKVAGEVVVAYKYLGKEGTTRVPVTVTINNRNALTWDDDRKAAAFITSTDPDVMLFAKNVASDAGSKAKPPAINTTFRIAMALFQAMNLQGVSYVTDPTTPYASSSQNKTALDFLQFPMQTFAYRAGDCDDLSILYSALLEAAGIRTALITVPGHIYAAFDLGMRKEDVKATFANPDAVIYPENESTAWLPIEITLVRKGFTEAWRAGAVDWQTNNAKGVAKFLIVRDAWTAYPPVSSSRVVKDAVRLPEKEAVFREYTAEMTRFMGIDFQPRATKLLSDLKLTENKTNTRLMNRLGILYARYGMLKEAKSQFEAALKISGDDASSAVFINIGNVSYLNGSFADAVSYYSKALEKKPGTPAALQGITLASYELGDRKSVDTALAQLKQADPEAADKLASLGSGTVDTASRAAASDKEVETWIEEE
jgi:tetratricopeptide (TPR) repeat protein